MATLYGAFALLAGLLAMLRLHGVSAFMVARRRNEIGVRIALGADRARVVRLVLREMVPLLTATLVFADTALVASYAPARRAASLEPMDALREE